MRFTLARKNTVCLLFNGTSKAAARFCAETFPDNAEEAVHRSLLVYPAGHEGEVLTVEFTVMGITCLGLNGGPASACGWCKDRWSLSWQITPRALIATVSAPDCAVAQQSAVKEESRRSPLPLRLSVQSPWREGCA